MNLIKYIFFLPFIYANPWKPINETYINPKFVEHITSTIEKIYDGVYYVSDNTLINLLKAKLQPTAIWLDAIERIKIPENTEKNNEIYYAEGILKNITETNIYKSAVFIVYNLPNRDCNAVSSNGNICCNTNDECKSWCSTKCQKESTECSDGMNKYMTYIDTIYETFNKYPTIKKILILEPDSLPNCVTSEGSNGCTKLTCNTYISSINYTISKLSELENVYMYLDIAHGGWLGPMEFTNKLINILSNFNTTKLQGFATNVANYQLIGKHCPFFKSNKFINHCKNNSDDECCYDPCNSIKNNNFANNELNYVQQIYYKTNKLNFGTKDGKPHFVIDSGRNGNPNARIGNENCNTWCNVIDARIGSYPTTETALNYVDAYAWIKTPGESDGCIDHSIQNKCSFPTQCNRYDVNCGIHPNNIGYYEDQPCAPEAGTWFDYQFIQLNKPF